MGACQNVLERVVGQGSELSDVEGILRYIPSGLNVEYKRKLGVKADTKNFGPSTWKRVAVD